MTHENVNEKGNGLSWFMAMQHDALTEAVRAALTALLRQSPDQDALLSRLEREGEEWAASLMPGAEASQVMTVLANVLADVRNTLTEQRRH